MLDMLGLCTYNVTMIEFEWDSTKAASNEKNMAFLSRKPSLFSITILL